MTLRGTWFDREIEPGSDWAHEIDLHLDTADIVLLFVSADFISSDYCWGVEMRRALERYQANEARVIPIIVRPVAWEETPIGELQALPTNGRPVTKWRSRDEAFLDVSKGIRRVVESFSPKTQQAKVQWVDKGEMLYRANRYGKALEAYEQAIQLDPSFAAAYYNKGRALRGLAQQAYKKAREVGYAD